MTFLSPHFYEYLDLPFDQLEETLLFYQSAAIKENRLNKPQNRIKSCTENLQLPHVTVNIHGSEQRWA